MSPFGELLWWLIGDRVRASPRKVDCYGCRSGRACESATPSRRSSAAKPVPARRVPITKIDRRPYDTSAVAVAGTFRLTATLRSDGGVDLSVHDAAGGTRVLNELDIVVYG